MINLKEVLTARGRYRGSRDSFDDFLEQLKYKHIEDPKVLIGALWLQEELKSQARRPLDHSTVKYSLIKHPDLFVGYKTGPIADVKDVSIWVNSENEDMIMDRFIGRTISANIRYLGAERDQADNVTEDIINEELISAVGPRGPVRIGTVIETSPGALAVTHGVKAILHVATVKGVGAGQGVRVDLDDIVRCTRNVLVKAHDKNRRFLLAERFKRFSLIDRILKRKNCESHPHPHDRSRGWRHACRQGRSETDVRGDQVFPRVSDDNVEGDLFPGLHGGTQERLRPRIGASARARHHSMSGDIQRGAFVIAPPLAFGSVH